MTATARQSRDARTGKRDGGRERPTVEVSSEPIAPAPKLRRRPILVAASIAAVCLGALLGVWAWSSTSNTQEVVAVRNTVMRGQTIGQADLMAVQVGVDPGLRAISGAELPSLIGQRAAMDMAAGSLVTNEGVTATVVPPAGKSLVGVALSASLMPGEPLRAGDVVRIVSTSGQDGEITQGQQVEIEASVVGLYPGAEEGKTVVSVLVPEARAGELAARAATGKVALVLDGRER